MKQPRSWWITSLLCLLLLSVYVRLAWWDQQASLATSRQPAPSFQARLLLSPAPGTPDTSLTLEQYRGKIVVLNFWASWCTSCRTETALLNRLQAEYGSTTLLLIGLATADEVEQTIKTATALAHQYLIAFDHDGSIARSFQVDTLPQTFLIDASGHIRYHLQGPLQDSNWAGLTRAIRQAQTVPDASRLTP